MKEIGTIISISGGTATIQINRGEKCEGCHVCDAFGQNKMQLEAYNKANAKVGDLVEISIEPKQIIKGSLLVFIFPLVMMILGYIIGDTVSRSPGETGGIIGSFTALCLSFVCIKILDSKKNKDAAVVLGLTDQNIE